MEHEHASEIISLYSKAYLKSETPSEALALPQGFSSHHVPLTNPHHTPLLLHAQPPRPRDGGQPCVMLDVIRPNACPSLLPQL